MTYRDDNDLVFLQYCDNEDLKILFDFLTKSKRGNKRWTTNLPNKPRVKNCGDNYKHVWDLIAEELQLYGADSIAAWCR